MGQTAGIPSSAHLDQFLCWVWILTCSSVEGIQTEINTKNTPGTQNCLSQNGMPPGQLRFLRVPLSLRPPEVGDRKQEVQKYGRMTREQRGPLTRHYSGSVTLPVPSPLCCGFFSEDQSPPRTPSGDRQCLC